MSNSLHVLLLLFASLTILAPQFQLQAQLLTLPVTKDPDTLQYITRVHQGNPSVPINLVLDLGGPFLWADCASSRNLIPRCSLQCAKARAHAPSGANNVCFSKAPTSTCHLPILNPFTGAETRGELVEDVLSLGSLYGPEPYGPIAQVNNFLYSCAPAFLLSGLASGCSGMLGLGRGSAIGPLSQISNAIGYHRKFFTCLSSSSGVLLLGDEEIDTLSWSEISKSLLYTPLVTGPTGSHEYFINVKSIKVNDRRLPVKGNIGRAKISSVVPYTTLASSIHSTFVKAYEQAAASMNMTRVDPVPPFGLCFSLGGVSTSQVGPLVPAIDLVLQSEMVKWRVTGMVQVSEKVRCLGFLDGGLAMDYSDSEASVVIGGFQLEDNLLEFDLGTNMLGFSSNQLIGQASCSNFVSQPSLLIDEAL